jgi:glutamate-1-semialdehyde 2,1-aminomutase
MAMTGVEVTEQDLARLDELIAEQEEIFLRARPEAARMTERAEKVLAGGATSSWQQSRPQVVWVSEGKGSKVWDVDGHEYVDMHGGYGAMLVGHAHPKIVEAVSNRVTRGTHFAQPTEDAIVVAEELARRWGLPKWRYGNSGTETTMDAVHLMRTITGRDKFVKIEGTYHGHHDSVMVSVYNEPDELGPVGGPNSARFGTGIPWGIQRLTLVVPFNDLTAVERVFAEHPGELAGMIIEPVMMNAGIIPPDPGYLEGIRRITREHGALLAYDEVKTGFTLSPGGATSLFGVTPDIVCLAKSLGGGIPCGAVGGSEEVMSWISDGRYEQVGTFNGNPLTMAAARAVVCDILDDAAYRHLDEMRTLMVEGCEGVIDEYRLPAHVVALGAKGCVTFSPTRIRNYRDFFQVEDRFSHAHWLFQQNGGVFLPPWGKAEQWLISVQHSEEDVQRFVANFNSLAKALRS